MRLIDAEPLEKKIFGSTQDVLTGSEEARLAFCTALMMVQLEPTVKADENQAEWKSKYVQTYKKLNFDVWCSSCGGQIEGESIREKVDLGIKYKYCPFCGAKMKNVMEDSEK